MDIKIKDNIYDFKIEDLISVGKRLNNTKRSFLFMSKLLGKHTEIKPNISKITGYMLADTMTNGTTFDNKLFKSYIDDCCNKDDELKINNEFEKYIDINEKSLILGFAESGTGLGMAVSCAIKDSYYIMTTREEITDVKSIFDFKEEHSHISSHMCYLKDINNLLDADRIILVDDEITTGNTLINCIKSLNDLVKHKKYTILSILDFRDDKCKENYKQLEKELDIKLETFSMLSANLEIHETNVFTNDLENKIKEKLKPEKIDIFQKEKHSLLNSKTKEYICDSGRFGVGFNSIRSIEYKAKLIARQISKKYIEPEDKVLILGHCEDIYIPARIASYIKNSVYKTTTRSPIFVSDEKGYYIKERSKFKVDDITYYLYNKSILENTYDKIFLITEFNVGYQLTSNIKIIRI